MKAMKIVTIICWMITALALTGLLIFFLTGTIFGFSSDKWDFGNNFGIGFSSFTENLTGPFTVDGTYNVAADNIDTLRINWVAGNVTVTPYDGTNIKITELAQRELSDREKLGFSVSSDTLTINFRERGSNRFGNMPRKQLEVLVPHALAENLSKLVIETVSGNVNIDGINASVLEGESVSADLRFLGSYGKVKLESVSGNLLLRNNSPGCEVNANNVSGLIDLLGSFNKVNIETVSGQMLVSSEELPTSFKAESVSGSLTIKLPAGSTVSVNHSAVSGKLTSDLPILMEGRGAAFTISSVSGNTKIEVLE